MIAPCGFRCDQCLAFVGNARSHADRVRGSAAWAKYYQLQVSPQHMKCQGCAQGHVEGLRFPDPKCEIRPCAPERGVRTCADCPDYPCATLQSRMKACDRAVGRYRGAIPDAEFARCIAPYDCRATLEELRRQQGADSAKSRGRKDR